jgi:hypothetical protein
VIVDEFVPLDGNIQGSADRTGVEALSRGSWQLPYSDTTAGFEPATSAL